MTLGRTALTRVTCRFVLACVLCQAATLVNADRVPHDEPITVFMAASLGDAVRDAVRLTGGDSAEKERPVRFSVAASSLLARQIEAGAPADIFLCANARWMNRLDMRGLLEHATRMSPIGNRLVLVQARSAPPWRGPLSSLPAQLEANARLAVADPAHVPAGLYAREALEAMGLWTQLSHRLAIADNVRGALALVARGEAPLGIVYATDARLSERVNVVAEFPASTHTPIRYQFAVVRNRLTPPVAALFERLTGAAALDVYAAHGFSIEQAEDTVRAQ